MSLQSRKSGGVLAVKYVILTDAACDLDPGVLKTLPEYQKKSTMLDALCHATESFWSVNSTDDSKVDSIAAIRGILANMEGYLANTDEGNAGML